jgi:hypothetical protein
MDRTSMTWTRLIKFPLKKADDNKKKNPRDYLPALIIFFMIFLVFSSILVVSFLFYESTQNRVKALRGTASMLASTISDPIDPRAGTEYWVAAGLENSRRLNTFFALATTFSDIEIVNVSISQRELQADVFQCRHFSELSNKIAHDLLDQQLLLREKGIEAKGTSFEAMCSITTELSNASQQLEQTYEDLVQQTANANPDSEVDMNNLRIKGIELTNYFYQCRALVAAAIVTVPAGDVSILAPFILITVLYSSFLLLPWILLLLFFLRKRKRIVESKTKMIADLNLSHKFTDTNQPEIQTTEKQIENVSNEIDRRAFREGEYLVSLILLTVINATLLYFFFYPNATSGLAQLISTGGGVRAFADYLASDSTPITFGFIGAYFFIIQMLLRRYFAADLNPNVYSYAVVRVLTVFLLSMILQLATSYFGWQPFAASVIAFVIGIFPSVGLRWIMVTANKLLVGLQAPEFIDRNPLTQLDGLNTWHEARFLEEKIENVQGLATASLEELIINTNFCPMQLIDWVDQSILSLHIQDKWQSAFRIVGIRTATDFIDNVANDKNDFEKVKAEKLLKALNSALVMVSNDKGRKLKQNTENKKSLEPPDPSSPLTPVANQISLELLEAIFNSIKKEPNIRQIQNYWQKYSGNVS